MRRSLALAAAAIVLSSAVCWANSGRQPSLTTTRSERVSQLQALIPQARTPEEQTALRYTLASILQDLGDRPGDLRALDGLEYQDTVLKERILVKQAQLSSGTVATAKWQAVLQLGGTLQPEALFQLGQTPELISRYPDHPRTALVLSNALDENPRQPEYVRQYLTYFSDQPASTRYAKQLETLGGLSPADWTQLAQVYSQQKEFQRTILALGRAPITAPNLLLLGKTYQALNQDDLAKQTFDQLAQQFPDQPEAGQGQLLKAALLPKGTRANAYQQIADRYPALGGTALWLAAKASSAPSEIYQQLVQRFPKSEEAVDAAWELAWSASNRGDLATARRLGQRAMTEFPVDKYTTPRLVFWTGRWAKDQGDSRQGEAYFRMVLQRFPASYYAWRSAAHLGIVEGEFRIRNLQQDIKADDSIPTNPLPEGSAVVQELYRLGLLQEASAQLQAETYHLPKLSPRKTATQAILLADQGERLAALRQLLPLAYADNQEMKDLHRFRSFWEAAYPTPYWSQLVLWGNQQRVNPLLALSLMRQESAFEPAIRSKAGALGLMQVMPATGRDIAQKLGVADYSLTNPADNIRFGTWYLAHTHDRWEDNSLLAVASYNAGPGNVRKWMGTLSMQDPERFVEQIPFRETKGYVKSVFGNYWNYLRLYSPSFQQRLAQVSDVTPKG